jgi:prophage regulatory protein
MSQETTQLLRLKDVLKIMPVSKSTWWAWVRSGYAPAPIRLGERCTCWSRAAIDNFISERGEV